ncbi:dihydrolipoyl dehydrogenase [Clostridium sp. WILCCON 0269]|uniref:Dihydrolipoyl dehydrogenase n=1 Tax=Candidatus Clostridium eludens TaxID=3381663 RepID=A0ABW8SK75_9CLOT
MFQKCDLIVIGAGPGGSTAALEAAKFGMKTAVIEKSELGGTCLNRGCIPIKTLLHAADIYRKTKESEKFGIQVEKVTVNIPALLEYKEEVIKKLSGGIEMLFQKNKIDLFHGTGKIIASHQVAVNQNGEEKIIESERILIASGSVTAIPPIPGIQLKNVVTSHELLNKKDGLYNHLLIIGGGVIGMEFAALYSAFGSKVTVIETMNRVLPEMDREIGTNLKQILKKQGVDIHTSSSVEKLEQAEEGKLLCTYSEKEKLQQVAADGVLVATGRKPHIEGLFDEGFTVETQKGKILVDEYYKTSCPSVYAIGDVIGGVQLAHAASAEALCAVIQMIGKEEPVNIKVIPGCVYTNPEIAVVGITGSEAKEAGLDVITKKYPMMGNGKSVLTMQERGFMKVVADRETEKILGAQLMCARATDIISEFTSAIVNGLTLSQMAHVIHPHPTFSEGVWELVRE